jgi:FlaA1/EpsC-like NDP-sugar epimerase
MKLKSAIGIKRLLAIFHDVVASATAWVLAYQLRFNFEVPAEHLAVMYACITGVVVVQMASFFSFGLYRGIWRFASVIDLQRIILAVVFSSLTLAALHFVLQLSFAVPRSVLLIDPALLILLMGGSRFVYRAIKEHQLYGLGASKGDPVVILGADQMALSLAKELSQGSDWRVVGMLTNDKSLHGREMSGIKVLGATSDLLKIQSRFGLSRLIIAQPLLSHQERRSIVSQAEALGIEVLTIPAADDLLSGRLNISQVRPVDVEDLLGRDVVSLDNSGLQKLIVGNAVLVSGAGGSIGSELCRQIVKFIPSQLICLDISEYALYQLEQELSGKGLSTQLVHVVADVKHEARLDKLLAQYKPKVVFHAAAYKHVPLMETDNVSEAFNNNVLGTYTLAKACKKAKVDKFVLVSTDKAVNPTNVMGATKRLAEMVCQGLQENKGTRFVMVRFGNVLGSSGSVIPKFREQIKAGGPITVTHPEITRYFMSISEAAQLVMQAGLMGKGGEIFVLDMGEPVKILDLAKDMIKLSGFAENEIRIEFSGLRPGEKLYEELLADDEHTLPTPHKKLRIASARVVNEKWVHSLLKWVSTTLDKDESLIKGELKTWVEDYQGDINAR